MSLILSPAPHVRTKNTTQRLMLNVVISLLPCAAAGIYYFGLRAAIVLAVSVVSAVLAELVWQKLAHQTVRINDFSAVVTGLLLGLCITPSAPWWMVMIGAFFAIIVVKQLFGGIGDNFLNPALTARAVLLASWPALMTTHCTPFDAVTSATPLMTGEASTMQLLLGDVPGAGYADHPLGNSRVHRGRGRAAQLGAGPGSPDHRAVRRPALWRGVYGH